MKKEYVFERNYKSHILSVHVVLLQREKVDNELLSFKIRNGSQIKYVSFKYSNTNIRLTSLYMNNMCNVEVRYEYFVEADVEDKVYYNGSEDCLQGILLRVKYNKALLFIRVE